MDTQTNALNWFEIPAVDLKRAKQFYEHIFGMEMSAEQDMMTMQMVMFPNEMGNGKVSGALVKSPYHTPSADGAVIYLNANPTIQTVIDRIEPHGGKVVIPRTEISPEIGYLAFFIDTEGNRVALHGQQ